MKHNHDLAVRAREILCKALKTEPACPERMLGSLASVHVPPPPGGTIRPSLRGYHDRLWDELIERHGIQVPLFPFPPVPPGTPATGRLLRIAMQAYNSIEQVEYLAACLVEELERERRG